MIIYRNYYSSELRRQYVGNVLHMWPLDASTMIIKYRVQVFLDTSLEKENNLKSTVVQDSLCFWFSNI